MFTIWGNQYSELTYRAFLDAIEFFLKEVLVVGADTTLDIDHVQHSLTSGL